MGVGEEVVRSGGREKGLESWRCGGGERMGLGYDNGGRDESSQEREGKDWLRRYRKKGAFVVGGHRMVRSQALMAWNRRGKAQGVWSSRCFFKDFVSQSWFLHSLQRRTRFLNEVT